MEVLSNSSNIPSGRVGARGQRRTLSKNEEDALIMAYYHIIADGLKQEFGSFKNGYIQALEKYMLRILPSTDIRATPHIDSKIKICRRVFGAIFTALSTSGIGWSPTNKMLDIVDESVWAEYCKKDSELSKWRNKSLPYYEDWLVIYGRDRATGEFAESPGDSLEEITKEQAAAAARREGSDCETTRDVNGLGEGLEDILLNTQPNTQPVDPSVSAPTSQPPKKKAKISEKSGSSKDVLLQVAERMHESISMLVSSNDKNLGIITQRLGYNQDLKAARKEVFGAVEKIKGLTEDEQEIGATLIAESASKLDVFFSLPDERRARWVRRLIKNEG